MRLLSCYVEGFGPLRAYSHSFTDGLNVFCEDNGFGKSSLAVFIKAMLYGLPASRSADPDENERRRYAPWDGGACGGALSFEVGGRRYRVERIFGRRESEDDFRLFSLDTGLPSDDYSAALGVELFGIDAAGYERSTYLSQRRLASGGYASIEGRLSEQGDLTQLERALAILDKRRKYYQMNGNRGRVSELAETVSAERRMIEDAEGESERLAELRAEIGDAENAIAEKQAERERLLLLAERRSAEDAEALLRESAARLTAAKESAERERHEARLSFGEAEIDGNEISEMLADSIELDEITEAERSAEAARRETRRKRRLFGLILLGTALPALILTVVLGLSIAAIVFGALTALAFPLLLAEAPREPETRAAAKQRKRLSERRRRRAEFLSRFGDPTVGDETAQLRLLRERAEALRLADGRLAEASAALSALLSAHPTLSVECEARERGEAPERLREMADSLSRAIEAERDRLLQKQHLAKGIEDRLAERRERGDHLSALLEEQRGATAYLSAILRAEELLGTAREALVTRYRDVLESGFRRYLARLEAATGTPIVCEEKGDAATVSAAFDVLLTSGGVTRAAALYSSGYRDLLALCLRLSICDALIAKECPPIVLDDPFVNLDDGKMRAALGLLGQLAADRQIIYFTCSESRSPL